MRSFKLREIPGVGPALAETLERKGWWTVEDILPVDELWLDEWLGPSRARGSGSGPGDWTPPG